jgi:phage/plasmid-like protein (TIGR03299 family)
MGHDLATKDGQYSTFHVAREGAPWHQLGTSVSDALLWEECMRLIHADFDVVGMPLYAHGIPGGPVLVPEYVLNVRNDDFRPLGVVSQNYKVVQNRVAFDFLNKVVEGGDLRYHTAGLLGDGERMWLLAKITGDIRVGKSDDVVEKYLLLYNSHDGSSALRCLFTAVRVVCFNTLSAALHAGEGTGVTIRHTGEIGRKIEEAQRALGLAGKYFKAFGEGADLLSGYTPTTEQLDKYFRALYPDPEKGDPARAKATRMALFGIMEQGLGMDMPGVRGTAYGAYNAVTQFVDHHTGTDMRRRLESSWWGDGSKLKIKAFDEAVKMAAN